MDFANRGNRPTQQQQTAPQTPMSNDFMPEFSGAKKNKKKMGFDFGRASSVFMLFGVALLSAVLIVALVFGGQTGNKEADLIDESKYQAIFLNSQDGQVYFGKMAIFNKDLYVLTDIYYVRVENPIQPEGENRNQQANISLAKLGNELHGPEDFMYIARDKVLYWENLKDEGQVVTAIKRFKETGGASQNTNTQQQQNTNNGGAAGSSEAANDAEENDTQTP